VVAEYLRTPAAGAACTFYAGFFVLISIGFSVLLWAAFRKSVLDPYASPAKVAKLPARSTVIISGNRRGTVQSLARDGNLYSAMDCVAATTREC